MSGKYPKYPGTETPKGLPPATNNKFGCERAVVGGATDKPIKRNKCQMLAPLSATVKVAGVFASALLFIPLHSRLPRSNKGM
mgnify:CR=1 FL=1